MSSIINLSWICETAWLPWQKIYERPRGATIKYRTISQAPRRSYRNHMSRVVRKPAFCICENKDADQLRGSREADQRLCFRYTDNKIPLLSKSEISSLYPSCVAVNPEDRFSHNEAHIITSKRYQKNQLTLPHPR